MHKTIVKLERIDNEFWKEEDREDFEHWLQNCPEIMKVTWIHEKLNHLSSEEAEKLGKLA